MIDRLLCATGGAYMKRGGVDADGVQGTPADGPLV